MFNFTIIVQIFHLFLSIFLIDKFFLRFVLQKIDEHSAENLELIKQQDSARISLTSAQERESNTISSLMNDIKVVLGKKVEVHQTTIFPLDERFIRKELSQPMDEGLSKLIDNPVYIVDVWVEKCQK